MVRAGLAAAVLSGAPSTAHAVVTRRPLLDPVVAAGTLVAPAAWPRWRLVPVGLAVHVAISLGWAAVLGALLPRRRPVAWGAAAGLAIAAVDLGVVGRRFPAVRALPTLPQVADHVAYGVVVGASLKPALARSGRSTSIGSRRSST